MKSCESRKCFGTEVRNISKSGVVTLDFSVIADFSGNSYFSEYN